MKFTCTQENLFQGLALVSHIAGRNASLPILSHVLMKTEDGGLKLSSTNLEISVSALVRGRTDEQGEFAVPARLFSDAVSLFSSGKIEMVIKDEALELLSEGQTTNMKGMAAHEFPLIPRMALGGGFRLPAQEIHQAISQVVFAVSASESRPELSGVACFFEREEEQGALVLAATDSYRLSERRVKLAPGSVNRSVRCIVPSRTMQEVGRILSTYKDDLAVPEETEWSLSENQVVMTYGNVELISRLIEGSFPDYRQIIPQQFRSVIKLKRAELVKAFRAASLFSRQGIFDVHLELNANGELKISSTNTGTGAHTTVLRVDQELAPNQVTLNYKYVTDGLAALNDDTVVLHIIDAMNPVLLRPSSEDKGFQYLVMPIRG